MLVQDLVGIMQVIAPLEYAEEWDRVGLLVGDTRREVSGPVLLTIDLTEDVLGEAIRAGASAIIAYHPPIFDPLNRVTDATPRQRVILRGRPSRSAFLAQRRIQSKPLRHYLRRSTSSPF